MKITNTNISSLLNKKKPATQEEQVAKQAQKWVAQTFYGTLLKQLRNSPFKSELFSGGRGAEAFGPMVDANIIDHLGKGTGKHLVHAVTKAIMNNAAKKAEPAAPKGGAHVSTIA